jgi:hypothetical protein
MKIKQVKEDIKDISKPIFHKLGFDQIGSDGESLKIDGNGNVFAIYIEEIKQTSSYSISVRACAKYKTIDDLFPGNESGYILNSILDSRSISFDSYSKEKLKEILDHLILDSAISFLNSYDSESKIFENVLLSDYKKWVITDKVSQFKARFASAMIANDNEALRTYINEANTFLQKPWAAMYEEPIKRLCASVQASM